MKRPVVIFDRECRFCSMWVEHWKEVTGDEVEYLPFQDAATREISVPVGMLQEAIHYIDAEGNVFRGAHAVFRFLAMKSLRARLLLTAYERSPAVAGISEFCYRNVAQHRSFFSWWTRLLCGEDLRKPQFAVSAWIFLRLLGVVFLIAFASLWKQLPGLIGSEGILPFSLFFKAVSSQLHGASYGFFPSLLWIHPTDQFLMVLLGAGIFCALALIFTFAQRWALFGCWIIYLSIISAGQGFMSFQWDVLLLETGFLSLFFVPRGWWQGTQMVSPSRAARFLLIWLLFRLMFASGLVKLSSGDVTWSSLAALNFHYFTQPLPNPVSWYMQQLPVTFQKVAVVIMFVIELGAPFLIFGGRRLRLLAFFSLVSLQVMIFLTGNYGFFNLLSIALCVLLLDDRQLRRKSAVIKQTYPVVVKWCAMGAGCLLFLLSLLPFTAAFRMGMPFPLPIISLYQWTLPFHLSNSYGLFEVMTTERNEITIEGSDDRINWKSYEFPYKPGPLNRPPPWAFFYMPRLDWQMWFAALSSEQENPWVRHFLIRLLHNSPPVTALLEKNPFAEKPPKYLRAQLAVYRFTNYEERAASGDWWKETPEGIYLPPVKLIR